MIAHNGSGFDNHIVLINLPPWLRVVHIFRNVACIISPKKFNGYVDKNNKIPQFVHFRCVRVHVYNNLGKNAISYNLEPCLLNQKLDRGEICEDTSESKEDEWLPYNKNDVLSTACAYARYSKNGKINTFWYLKNPNFTLLC